MRPFILSFLLLASFASCKKENSNQSPRLSNSGKNILSCKVNGAVHQYSGLIDYMFRLGVGNRRFIDKLVISARGKTNIYDDAIGVTVHLPPDSIESNTTYQLGVKTNNMGEYTIFHVDSTPDENYVTTAGSGWIRFSRVDTAVSAGTFAFTGYLETPTGIDSVVITEGVFDIASE